MGSLCRHSSKETSKETPRESARFSLAEDSVQRAARISFAASEQSVRPRLARGVSESIAWGQCTAGARASAAAYSRDDAERGSGVNSITRGWRPVSLTEPLTVESIERMVEINVNLREEFEAIRRAQIKTGADRAAAHVHPLILLPGSRALNVWETAVLFGILASLAMFPLMALLTPGADCTGALCCEGTDRHGPFVSADESAQGRKWSVLLGAAPIAHLVSAIAVADVGAGFVTAYVQDGKKVTDLRRISRRYLHGNFALDALGALPLWSVLRLASGGCVCPSAWVHFAGLNHMLRLTRLNRALASLPSASVQSIAANLGVNPNVPRLTVLLFWLFVCLHCGGCYWYAVRHLSFTLNLHEDEDEQVRAATRISSRYALALWWAITTTFGGEAPVAPVYPLEQVYVGALLLLGVAIA